MSGLPHDKQVVEAPRHRRPRRLQAARPDLERTQPPALAAEIASTQLKLIA